MDTVPMSMNWWMDKLIDKHWCMDKYYSATRKKWKYRSRPKHKWTLEAKWKKPVTKEHVIWSHSCECPEQANHPWRPKVDSWLLGCVVRSWGEGKGEREALLVDLRFLSEVRKCLVMVAWTSKCTKCHFTWVVRFKWVNYVVCEI